MLTRCPACSTTFRVTPAQLKARAGKVRCGQCNLVFNALDSLDEEHRGVVPEASQTIPAEAQHLADTGMASSDAEEGRVEAEAIDIGEADVLVIETEDIPPQDTVIETPSGTNTDTNEVEVEESGPEPESETAELTDYLAAPLLHDQAAPARRWPWIAGSVVAILALLLQMLYFYRVEVAVLQPGLRPLLQAACKPLNCEVPRPRSIETLSIEASDLRPDPEHPGRLTLTATLRSKAVFAQEWPMLELTLTDVADGRLAVKDFAAANYLPRENNEKARLATLAAGFPPNGQIAVNLPLDVGDLPAAGYRLYIFYP